MHSCGYELWRYDSRDFAAKYPEKVSALYLDAPVMNFLSCPANFGIAKGDMLEDFLRDRKMTLSELIWHREHPIDKFLC